MDALAIITAALPPHPGLAKSTHGAESYITILLRTARPTLGGNRDTSFGGIHWLGSVGVKIRQ